MDFSVLIITLRHCIFDVEYFGLCGMQDKWNFEWWDGIYNKLYLSGFPISCCWLVIIRLPIATWAWGLTLEKPDKNSGCIISGGRKEHMVAE